MLKWFNDFDEKSTVSDEVIRQILDNEDYLNENDLVIKNDKEFKVHVKPKTNKIQTQHLIVNKNENKNAIQNTKNKEIEKLIDNDFNIQCKVMRKPNISIVNESSKKKQTDDKINLVYQQSSDNVSVKDLQTVLIMMAITSKPDESETTLYTIENPNKEAKEIDFTKEKVSFSCESIKNDEIEDILNVIPIRATFDNKIEKVVRKYVKKWKDYVSKRKDYISQQRQDILNNFLNKLEKKKLDKEKQFDPRNKAKMNVRDFSTYQHRYIK